MYGAIFLRIADEESEYMDDEDEDQLPPFGVCSSSYCHLDKDVWGGSFHWIWVQKLLCIRTPKLGGGACTLETRRWGVHPRN